MIDFFLRRPVFASVCAIIITLAGAMAVPRLPIAQYPDLAPPQVTVTATYVGASSDVVETAVTIPLEQEINGVEGMKYISSTSTNDGVATVTITFQPTRDLEVAAVDVRVKTQGMSSEERGLATILAGSITWKRAAESTVELAILGGSKIGTADPKPSGDVMVNFRKADDVWTTNLDSMKKPFTIPLGPIAEHLMADWATQRKGRALWCVGKQIYKVQTVLHPAAAAFTYTNQAIDGAR